MNKSVNVFGWDWGGGRGVGEEVPASDNSTTIHDIEMKFGGVVKIS